MYVRPRKRRAQVSLLELLTESPLRNIDHKKNCFAYNVRKSECSILKDTECVNCKFYKTHAQSVDDRNSAIRKINAMTPIERGSIFEKYEIAGYLTELKHVPERLGGG